MLLDLGVVLACLALWTSWDNFCRALALWTGQQKQHLIGHSRLDACSGHRGRVHAYSAPLKGIGAYGRAVIYIVRNNLAKHIDAKLPHELDAGVWELFLSNVVSVRKERVIRAVPMRALPRSASAASTTTTTGRSTVPPGHRAIAHEVPVVVIGRAYAARWHEYGWKWRLANNLYSVANAGKHMPYTLKLVWQLLTHAIYSTTGAAPHIAKQTPPARQVGGRGSTVFIQARTLELDVINKHRSTAVRIAWGDVFPQQQLGRTRMYARVGGGHAKQAASTGHAGHGHTAVHPGFGGHRDP
ncbi:hypothetical protein B0H11DRAFT_2235888 [Mycena galericulata]|nr:hypothetical protein B0H11DRAFT_2235888 [Mycena galericulata]